MGGDSGLMAEKRVLKLSVANNVHCEYKSGQLTYDRKMLTMGISGSKYENERKLEI